MSEVRAIRYADVLGAPNAAELISGYAAECSVPMVGVINPQVDIYSAMEQSGIARCFGVYDGKTLVGFSNVMHTMLPHYGVKVAATESLYIDKDYRRGGAGSRLMSAGECDARESGCVSALYSAPVNSR